MIPTTVTIGPSIAAAVATGIAVLQNPVAANLTLNGSLATAGVATMDVARQVIITSSGDDSLITFAITGTNSDGMPWKETVTGTNASIAKTTSAFKTVTQIKPSAATAGNVTSGTNGVAMSPWKFVTWHGAPVNVSFACIVTGTANFSVQVTYEDFNAGPATTIGSQSLGNFPTVPTPFNHPVLNNLASTQDSTTNDPIIAWRLVLNSGSGTVKCIGVQAGIAEGNWQ